MHGSGYGFEKILYVNETGGSACSEKESRSAYFSTKMAPCLWWVDLSFMNSDTGSSNIAISRPFKLWCKRFFYIDKRSLYF